MARDVFPVISEPLVGHELPSAPLRGHELPSAPIRDHVFPSAPIRGHVFPSALLGDDQRPPSQPLGEHPYR